MVGDPAQFKPDGALCPARTGCYAIGMSLPSLIVIDDFLADPHLARGRALARLADLLPEPLSSRTRADAARALLDRFGLGW